MSVDNVKIWCRMTNINLVVSSVTAKSPNLNHRQNTTTVPPSALGEDKQAFRKKDGRSMQTSRLA